MGALVVVGMRLLETYITFKVVMFKMQINIVTCPTCALIAID